MKQRPDLIQQKKLKEPPAQLSDTIKERLQQLRKKPSKKEEFNETSHTRIR